MKRIFSVVLISGSIAFGSINSASAAGLCPDGGVPGNAYDGTTLGQDICYGTGWSPSWSSFNWWRVAYNYWF